MWLIKKIISAGNDHKKTRLHDEKGKMANWQVIFAHSPKAIFSGFKRILFGIRPEMPWIGYGAIKVLKKFLTKKSRVLEFGSGMSTIWYAKHGGEVFSVENDPMWYAIILNRLKNKNIKNVNYQLLRTKNYINFMKKEKRGFDLIVIDGMDRDKCAKNAIKLIRPGGIIYLDNSDSLYKRAAETILLSFARKRKAQVEYFVDFAPAQFFVNEGMMIRVPG